MALAYLSSVQFTPRAFVPIAGAAPRSWMPSISAAARAVPAAMTTPNAASAIARAVGLATSPMFGPATTSTAPAAPPPPASGGWLSTLLARPTAALTAATVPAANWRNGGQMIQNPAAIPPAPMPTVATPVVGPDGNTYIATDHPVGSNEVSFATAQGWKRASEQADLQSALGGGGGGGGGSLPGSPDVAVPMGDAHPASLFSIWFAENKTAILLLGGAAVVGGYFIFRRR